MNACSDKALLLHALVDNELDVASVALLQGHVTGCAGCAAELRELQALKSLLADERVRHAPPTAWRQRAISLIDRRERQGRGFAPWIAGGSIAAVAAGIALVLPPPTATTPLPDELVAGQIRSLQAQHLLDVPTSDRHVVKPWFNGKVDFAPPVVDLAAQGFPLAGGRLDYIGGRTVAAIVYRRRAHIINLFVWPGQSPETPATIRRQGYSLIRWGHGGLIYWAVSDIDPNDLVVFQQQFTAATR